MLTRFRLPLFLAAAALCAQERFDYVVRNDFFAGLSGNRAALDRAMKKCEETLAANPKHPETTGLLFNFDGTVQSGLGDPRQAQLGLRLIF